MAKTNDTHDAAKKKSIDIEVKVGDKTKNSASTAKVAKDKTKNAPQSASEGQDDAINRNGQEHDEALKTAQENLAAEKDRYLRLAAEYDNFRKRSSKERDTIYGNAKADVIGKLLPVYDNLERALKQECSDEAYFKGIEMIMLQLTEILKDLGVNPIPATGEPFDPNLHNAVMRIEDPTLGEGIVAEECQRGFTLGERVLRFSSVVVAN